jgi:ribonucleoside-diphosphate reductase alpha chain
MNRWILKNIYEIFTKEKPMKDNPFTVFEDPFSKELWESTYKYHEDGDVNDTFHRMAVYAAQAEKTDELKSIWAMRFENLFKDFKGVAGGRIIANAGTEFKGTTMMNCFVSPRANYDIDSIENIIKHALNCSLTLKSEGGWGSDFSWIRPRTSFIHGVGVESPGAVKFMEIFDKVSDVVTSGSGKKKVNAKGKNKIRKGAMMGVIHCAHPDVEEFIRAKQQPGRLSKFNVSVNCSDEFIQKVIKVKELKESGTSKEEVEREDKWELWFPDTQCAQYKTLWTGDFKEWKERGFPRKVYKTVSALGLWDTIMESTFNRAEPGVLYLDRANYFNPYNYGETIYATNPCVTGDTLVTLRSGEEIAIKELIERYKKGENFEVLSYNIENDCYENKRVIWGDLTRKRAKYLYLDFDNHRTLKVTPDHKIYTRNRGYVRADELTSEDDVVTELYE